MFNDSFNKAMATAHYKENFLEMADYFRRTKCMFKIQYQIYASDMYRKLI